MHVGNNVHINTHMFILYRQFQMVSDIMSPDVNKWIAYVHYVDNYGGNTILIIRGKGGLKSDPIEPTLFFLKKIRGK